MKCAMAEAGFVAAAVFSRVTGQLQTRWLIVPGDARLMIVVLAHPK